MSDGSSTTSAASLIGAWTTDPCCTSRTCRGCLLQTTGMLWPESFRAWPTSGTASPGGLFQLPPLEHPIDAFDGGALLGTPRKSTGRGASSAAVARGEHRFRLEAQIAMTMLPTPTAHDAKDGPSPSRANRQTIDLGAIALLLPTPTTQMGSDGQNRQGGPSLNSIQQLIIDEIDDSTILDGTPQRSSDGKLSWVEQRLNLRTTDTSPQSSPSG